MGYDNRFWGLQQIADMFPSLNPPDIRILLVCFLIYLVLVAPVIYLLLYKIDKREWAWWLIPAVSVATSIVIFLVGVADKRTMMTHSVQTIELTGLGDGFQTGVTAIFRRPAERCGRRSPNRCACLPIRTGTIRAADCGSTIRSK
ncbi:hypothetical protein PACILC2_51200 [Paenibacillus cisolokensis]|uniref:Uncharacterized protein n=1 Tax=Paenibacillus cisolokensis TaxID=1658519 RepID=A0ABQ4NE99_9BACL|nr:hypothetical protein [Paenibacillus cisolokensis]GIQ66552.1 hypothetical protein PACILC2_51200 [Paenibacillus cisolokensis]